MYKYKLMSITNNSVNPIMVPLADMFRPVTRENTITDEYSEIWKQVSATGYLRVSDNFFWPDSPTICSLFLGQKPPTVEQVQISRKNHNL